MDMSKINEDQMTAITGYLIENVFRNEKIVCSDAYFYDYEFQKLIDIVASLHNLLYKEVNGDYYDYMFHWLNKATGTVDLEDHVFDNILKAFSEDEL